MAAPKPSVRKTLAVLIQAAAAGRADLAWLDGAIRKAGYVPAVEAVTKEDLKYVREIIVDALAAAENEAKSPCCKEAIRRAIETIEAVVAGK